MWAKRKKIEKCLWCETTKIRHKGNGLCLNCYDKKRLENPKRKINVNNQKKRYYQKHKDEKEFKEKTYQRVLKFQQTKTYKNWLKNKYKKESYKRFLKTKYHNHWRDTLEIIIEGKKVKTPLKTLNNNFIKDKELFIKVYKTLVK